MSGPANGGLPPDRLIAWPRPEDDPRFGGPPFRSEQLGAWVVSAYEDVDAAARDAATFCSANSLGLSRNESLAQRVAQDPRAPVAQNYFRMALIASDGAKHRREHDFIVRAFSPKAFRAMEPHIQGLCDELTDAILKRGGGPFVQEFAVPVAVRTMAHWFGLPPEDFAAFKRWSDGFEGLTGSPDPAPDALERFLAATVEFTEYMTPLIEQRRREPADDFISALAVGEVDGERLRNDEILSMTSSQLLAGNATTTASIAGAMLYLVGRPELQERLRTEPPLIPAFVEEGLRLTAPSQGLYRTATADAELGGVPIGAGEHLFLYYAVANRDPARFGDPSAVRLDRPDKRHLTFSRGPHTCLGAPLARGEMRIAFETLLARTRSITLSDRAGATFPIGNVITRRVGELYVDVAPR